jgi:hypothetical protein
MSAMSHLTDLAKKVNFHFKLSNRYLIAFINLLSITVYVEVYGCQMNVNDTEIIFSILKKYNYSQTNKIEEASIVLLMTCAIREGAEQKIWHRLSELRVMKRDRRKTENPLQTIGVIGLKVKWHNLCTCSYVPVLLFRLHG